MTSQYLTNSTPFLITLPTFQLSELSKCQWTFALDRSLSTGNEFFNNTRILDIERDLAMQMAKNLEKKPNVIAWNNNAVPVTKIMDVCIPSSVSNPECILKDTKKILMESQVLVLMTNSKIKPYEVESFATLLFQTCNHLLAIIGVIVERITNGYSILQPYQINTSVFAGLGAMGNSCILFHNGYETYVMNAWGEFYDAWKPVNVEKRTVWPGFGDPSISVTTINPKDLSGIKIKIPSDKEMENKLIKKNYIPIGQNCFFKYSKLLEPYPEWDEFPNLPWSRICLFFKTTGRYRELLNWFLGQKKMFANKFFPNPTKKETFNNILDQIVNDRSRQNMDTYIQMRRASHINKYSIMDDTEIKKIITDTKLLLLFIFFKNMANIIHYDFHDKDNNNTYTTYSMSYYKNPEIITDGDF